MADTSFKDYPINFLLAGLFVLGLVGFGVGLAHNYGESSTLIVGNTGLDLSRLESQLNQTASDTSAWSEVFKSDNGFVAFGSIVLYSVWGIGKLIFNSVITIWIIISDGAVAVLGIPPLATAILLAVLVIGLIFSLWRIIKLGW